MIPHTGENWYHLVVLGRTIIKLLFYWFVRAVGHASSKWGLRVPQAPAGFSGICSSK